MRITGKRNRRHRGRVEAGAALQDWQCFHCRAELTPFELTADHIIPSSRGGAFFVVSCRPCNNGRSTRFLDIPATRRAYFLCLRWLTINSGEVLQILVRKFLEEIELYCKLTKAKPENFSDLIERALLYYVPNYPVRNNATEDQLPSVPRGA